MAGPPQKTEYRAPPERTDEPGEITRVLDSLSRGDDAASERLLKLVYGEIRRLAQGQIRGEDPNRTLQATALINETYLRLFGGPTPQWENRAHFFASAAEVMRRVLVDAARKRAAGKRGAGRSRVALIERAGSANSDPAVLLAVDEALQQMAAENAQRAAIVKLRFFSGLTVPETAAALGLALRTVEREWRFARAWLLTRLSDAESGGHGASLALEE